MKTALTIAGSDCSGGAGIQADIKTMITNGVYAMSAITALTAQNTTGVTAIMESTPEFLGEQLESIFTDIYPDAVKIGMVSSSSLIKTISDKLKKYDAKNIVVDPVMVATSGAKLISDEAVSTLKEHLFPLATVLTPNIPEAEVLSEMKISNEEEMIKAAEIISEKYGCAVLCKGGHQINDANDLLFKDGTYTWYNGKRINNPNTHGTGVSIAEILTGTYFAPLGFEKGILAVIIGHIIGCAMLFCAGLIGGKCRKSSMETVKMSFGNKGGLLFSVLNVIQLVGWTAIMIYDGSLSVNSILNMGDTGRWIACIVIGALIVLWILVGISNLGKLNTIAMAALFILTIVMCFFIFGNGNGMGAAGDDSMSFGAAVELSVAMPLSWLPLISDYTREAEKPFKATLASTLVYGAVSCWMYIIGMSASILTGESDIAKIMLKSGLSIAGLVIVILSTVTTTFLDAYSAGISSESIFSKLKGKYVAVAVTIVGVIAAIVYPMDDITDFLYLIGSVFAPMIAIQIADFFILKKDRANKAVDICNIIVWLAGFAAYRFLMNVDIIVGNTLPDMVFTIILCVIVTKIADKITSKSQKA